MPVADTNSRLAATTVPRHLWAKGTSEPFTGQENPPRFFCRGKKRRLAESRERTVPPSSYESQRRLIASFAGNERVCGNKQPEFVNEKTTTIGECRVDERRRSCFKEDRFEPIGTHGSVKEEGWAQHRPRCVSQWALNV